jgi:hypothetical protein
VPVILAITSVSFGATAYATQKGVAMIGRTTPRRPGTTRRTPTCSTRRATSTRPLSRLASASTPRSRGRRSAAASRTPTSRPTTSACRVMSSPACRRA